MQQNLLVLGAGPLQIPAITTARRLGVRVVAADGNPAAPGLALADASHVVNITSPEACLAVARVERVDGVIHICSEVAMASMALINQELALHGLTPETVVRATNKEQMRRAFERGGAPSPRSIAVTTGDAALIAARTIGGALIFKPSRNSGSRGITHVLAGSSPEILRSAFIRAMDESRDHSALVEQFVQGPEFSVEALVWNGRIEILAVTDKLTTGEPHFVEMGHSQPTQLPHAEYNAVRDAAVKGIQALGLDWCAAHAEVKLAAGKAFLMEIGARLGGDFITTELVPRSTGIDMLAAAIRLALGNEPDLSPTHTPRGAAIRYLTPPQGKVQRIDGIADALRLPGVRIVDVYVNPGNCIGAIDSSLVRSGHVIADGATAAEAIFNAERARETVVIRTV